jgi:hypothetical protein
MRTGLPVVKKMPRNDCANYLAGNPKEPYRGIDPVLYPEQAARIAAEREALRERMRETGVAGPDSTDASGPLSTSSAPPASSRQIHRTLSRGPLSTTSGHFVWV